MANKERSRIYSDVVELLKKGSYTTLQIADLTKINWETAKNAVDTLVKINLVSPKKENGKTYYSIDEANFLQLRKDTLLGLPLSDEQLNISRGLLKRIDELWIKYSNKPLSKTFRQKILIKLVKRNNIQNIPYGWYLFGQCAVLFMNEEENIVSNKSYDKEIIILIKEYQQISTTKELLELHYLEEGNELYNARIRISDILLRPFDNSSIQLLKQDLRRFVFSFPKNEENSEIMDRINGFYSIIIRLINGSNIKELDDNRPLINDVFMALWELIATFNLYQSLKGKNWYEPSTLYRYYKLRIEMLLPEVDAYILILKDHCIPLVPEDEPLKKFKGPRAK